MRWMYGAVLLFLCLNVTPCSGNDLSLHVNIVSTIFWVGEEKSADNGFIQNESSAWDNQWMSHYGGVDDPVNRQGYYPAEFIPKENPFYYALPYNDFRAGVRKFNSGSIPWAEEEAWGSRDSMCKNQWIAITKNGKTVYAQWEDVGPFLNNDFNYVFGMSKPKNVFNSKAGIDVSPAVATYLELQDVDIVSWQFVDESEVPDGPWREIVTTSQIYWE